MPDPNQSSFMKTGKNEYIKTYAVYDGSNRITGLYEARANAQHGHPALLTTYAYSGATSNILKTLEAESTWDSSYDI